MRKLKSIIVDDEKSGRLVMRNLLETEFPMVELVGEAANADAAYELICQHRPDVVFLDIQMPKANGFSLLKRFDDLPFETIFVTSYDSYAINAIKFSALDYLLKPIEIPDLRIAIEKAIKMIELKQNNASKVANLINNLSSNTTQHKLAVHKGDKVRFIEEANIMYIEGDRRYCHLYTTDGETYTVAKYLWEFEEYFEAKTYFVRISKSHMINTAFIKEYYKGDPFVIVLENGKEFEASRRKKAEILEKIKGS